MQNRSGNLTKKSTITWLDLSEINVDLLLFESKFELGIVDKAILRSLQKTNISIN